MSKTLSATIPQTTVPNDGSVAVLGTVSFAAVTPVNILAGQSLDGANITLNTDVAPSTYSASGTLLVRATDQIGNGYQVTVTYTGIAGDSFTGCNLTGSTVSLTSTLAPALPDMTGQVLINRTGAGSHPWLNTLTAATQITLAVQSSTDGGVTWHDEASFTTIGGNNTGKGGVSEPQVGVGVGPINPAANAVRLTASVPASSPSPVFVSGTGSVTTL